MVPNFQGYNVKFCLNLFLGIFQMNGDEVKLGLIVQQSGKTLALLCILFSLSFLKMSFCFLPFFFPRWFYKTNSFISFDVLNHCILYILKVKNNFSIQITSSDVCLLYIIYIVMASQILFLGFSEYFVWSCS